MYPQTIGQCHKCHQLKITVDGEVKCLRCDTPKPKGSKLVNTVEDPGEAGLAKVLSESGITLPVGGAKPEPINKPIVKVDSHFPVFEVSQNLEQATSIDSLSMALVYLKKIPVPKDLKQFKKIRKAIDLLESLGA